MALTVSVYVPCYNAAGTIGLCLASLLAQVRRPDEILLIDDGSTDDSIAIATRFPAVRIIRHDRNLGLAAARNTGIAHATGDLVASIDSDCAADPRWLLTLAKNFERNPRLHGCGGKLVEHYTDGAANAWRAAHLSQHHGNRPVGNPKALYGANTVFRRTTLAAVGGYRTDLRTHGEDWDLCRRIYRHIDDPVLVYDPRAIVRHLRRDTIASVVRTYWNYQTYISWRDAPQLSLRWRLTQIFRLMHQISWPWLRRDLSEGRWSTLLVAAVGVPYLAILHAAAWRRARRALRAERRSRGMVAPPMPPHNTSKTS